MAGIRFDDKLELRRWIRFLMELNVITATVSEKRDPLPLEYVFVLRVNGEADHASRFVLTQYNSYQYVFECTERENEPYGGCYLRYVLRQVRRVNS